MIWDRFVVRQLALQELRIQHLEEREHKMSADQDHIEADVAAIKGAFTSAIDELKAQIAAGTSAAALDFTSLDAVTAAVQAEANADAPPAPPAA